MIMSMISGRAAEEGDRALGRDVAIAVGAAQAAFVDVDGLAGERRPAPPVVGRIVGLPQITVLREMLSCPLRASISG